MAANLKKMMAAVKPTAPTLGGSTNLAPATTVGGGGLGGAYKLGGFGGTAAKADQSILMMELIA